MEFAFIFAMNTDCTVDPILAKMGITNYIGIWCFNIFFMEVLLHAVFIR